MADAYKNFTELLKKWSMDLQDLEKEIMQEDHHAKK